MTLTTPGVSFIEAMGSLSKGISLRDGSLQNDSRETQFANVTLETIGVAFYRSHGLFEKGKARNRRVSMKCIQRDLGR